MKKPLKEKLKQIGGEHLLNEGFSSKKVDTKIIAKRMMKDKSGWWGKGWAKMILKKYRNGVSERDLDRDMPDYVFGGAISALFKGLDEGKINEELLNEENESTWTWVYKGLLSGFKKAKDGRLDVVAKAVAFLIKTEYGRGAKNDFIKAFKKSL